MKDKDKIIEILKEVFDHSFCLTTQLEDYADRILAIQEEEWRSVNNSPVLMGGSSEDYLAYDGDGVFEAEFSENGWYDYEAGAYTYKVTHWMPLPEPPTK